MYGLRNSLVLRNIPYKKNQVYVSRNWFKKMVWRRVRVNPFLEAIMTKPCSMNQCRLSNHVVVIYWSSIFFQEMDWRQIGAKPFISNRVSNLIWPKHLRDQNDATPKQQPICHLTVIHSLGKIFDILIKM